MSAQHDDNNKKKVLSPSALNTVGKILENVNDMLEPRYDSFHLTRREVVVHDDAFQRAVEGSDPGQWPEEVKECESKLKDLMEMVSRRQDAITGDEDRELKGKENYISPFKIPVKRRIQTLVVSLFLFFTMLPLCTTLTIVLLMFPVTMPFMVAYIGYIIYANKTVKWPIKGRKFWRDGFVMKHYRDYFPARLAASPKVRAAMDPKKNYLFCYHPHGIHAFGAMINFGSDANQCEKMFPGLTFHVQTLGINFILPFFRHFCTWGGSGDASAKCLRQTLTAGPGETAVLVVGGAEESLLASPKTNNLTLSKRKGFIKIALQTGATLVPVFGFGENDVYGNLAEGRPKLQKFMKLVQKKLGFALPLISGRGYFNYNWGLIPHRRPIVTVVGMPLDNPKIEKPTQEEIDEWHAKYVQALMELYQENKGVYDLMAKSVAKVVN